MCIRLIQHLIIGDAALHFDDVENFPRFLAELIDDLTIYTLVCEEDHAAFSGIG